MAASPLFDEVLAVSLEVRADIFLSQSGIHFDKYNKQFDYLSDAEEKTKF